eukprot:TRINITY_DN13559_c0_g1_i1.p2 TRINITY_DN13559_c0_g1~~TRINITY_DN13559_c0_g1_i1.p2  ORF type:complete len:154 (-),score=21.62 TRINITY_DN13559_c0_g1_i1:106-567(-)
MMLCVVFFFQAEDGIRDHAQSRGLGDVYKRQEQRYEVPIRNFEIDNNNIYQGKIQFFWSVALPIIHNQTVYLPLAKVGNFGEGFMESGSGAILSSPNILKEADPTKIIWETLPDGDQGLLPPQGKVADEHNLVSLNSGGLYCVSHVLLSLIHI